jgi:hypothetical protein
LGVVNELQNVEALGAWGGYSNGQIPLNALMVINYPGCVPYGFPGSLSAIYMEPRAGAAMVAMLTEYHNTFGGYVYVNEGYRTLAGQQYWWDYHHHDPAMAAPPGTSNHGWGQAFDFDPDRLTSAQVNWARSVGGNFGYTPIGSERWHFNYTGNYVPVQPDLEGSEEEVMYIRRETTGDIAIFGGYRNGAGTAAGRHQFTSLSEYNEWRNILSVYNQQIDAQGLDAIGKKFIPPADPANILGVNENDWGVICGVYGV